MSLKPYVKPALRIRLIAVVSAFALLSQIVFIGPVRKADANAKVKAPVTDTSSPAEPFIVHSAPTLAGTIISGVASLLGFVVPTTAKKEAPKTGDAAVEPPSPATAKPAPMMSSATPAQLAALRLQPGNATGGTDLYSRNFGWGTSLVGLPGRAGLDAGFGISYNSLVWIKDTTNSEIIFDPELSNVSPGFHIGLPEIEKIYNTGGTNYSFLVVNANGSRTEFRRVGTTTTFEAGDSSYRQLIISTGGVTSKAANIELTVTSTDGTMMHYLYHDDVSKYLCEEIKDRNGNIVSVGYTGGRLSSMEDTLGRTITVNHDGGGYPTTIEQTWKNSNGSGSNVTHTWATFDYVNATVSTSFSGLTVIGPANSTTVKVLEKITYPDSSFTKFEYNGYIQVKKISQVAADSTSHILNYVTTDLSSVSGSQTDCPRFGETKTWVENFNGGSEVVVTNSLTTGASFSLPNSLSGTGKTRIDVAMTGHPDGLYTRIYVDPSGYKEGLPLATEDCTGTNCATRLRWTWTDWTQDNTGVSYITNPRVIESRVGDGSNTKRTTIDYGSNGYGLPEIVKVYDTNLTTVLKKQRTLYELSSTYTNKRIIGLPKETELWEGDGTTLMSMALFAYDGETLTGTDPVQNISPVQHDNTNYSSTYVAGRGNLTSSKRCDVTSSTPSSGGSPTCSGSVETTFLHNTAGAVVQKTDPLSRTVKIDYTDNFNSSPGVSTYAYPKRIYDPAGNYSEIKYRYDIGANVEATSPAPAGQTYGKTSKREYDDTTAMLKKNSIYVNTTLKSYTRFAVPSPDDGVKRMAYSTVIDNDSDGADADDEVLTETWSDGAGRIRLSRTPHTFDVYGATSTWAGVQTEYDILGRVYRTSVPTETNSSWVAVGDDSVRDWIWNKSYYDWKGRTIRTVPSDSTGSDGKDTLISYAGCGCAGGQVTTISGPETDAIDANGDPQTDARRTQKIYEDILGRTYKTEIWDLDGAGTYPYSTVKTTFNGRDQATLIRQYDGPDSSSTYQDTTMSYDGHGRLYQSHKPEQRDGSNNLKYTTYAYNLDDSVATQTDGRGVVTSYTYNSRGLVTNIGWNVGATGVTDPTDVTFTYDNLGNRTQMTDGLGQVDYSYSELSQMIDETRDFTDTLTDAPIGGSKFKLEYTYTLSGGLKSYKDPYGEEIDYTHDKTGRLNTVTGTSFGGVTDYASGPEYRAWGGLKHLDYGNGMEMDAVYNNKLQTATYELKHPTDTSKKIFDKEYEYYNDGSLKFIEENLDPTIKRKDRLYVYDFAQKLVQAKSGTEASGTTQTNLFFLPYRQTYAYDAFGHNTERESTLWTEEEWDFYDSYTNNRRPGWTYNDNGNALSAGGIDYEYDGANSLIKNSKTAQFEMTIAKGGDGHEGKRASRKWNAGTSSWEAWETNYFIASSVLGGTVSEAGDTGKKKRTFVFANGSTLARQVVDDEDAEAVSWDYSDASGQSIRLIGADGTGTGADVGGGENDALGNNVGTHGSLSDPRNSEGELSPANHSPISPEIMCERGGIIGVCSVVSSFAAEYSSASRPSGYPFAYAPRHTSNSALTEQFRVNSLENIQGGYFAEIPGNNAGGEEGCTEAGCDTTVTWKPSTIAWVPYSSQAGGPLPPTAPPPPAANPLDEISKECKDQVSLLTDWNKVEAILKTPPFIDIDATPSLFEVELSSMAKDRGSNYFGVYAKPGESVATTFDRERKGSPVWTVRGDGIKDGIYFRGPLQITGNFLLHEVLHLVFPEQLGNMTNLDAELVLNLNIKKDMGMSDSDAVSRFFNSGCLKKYGGIR